MACNHLHVYILEHLAFLAASIPGRAACTTLRPVKAASPLTEQLTCLESVLNGNFVWLRPFWRSPFSRTRPR